MPSLQLADDRASKSGRKKEYFKRQNGYLPSKIFKILRQIEGNSVKARDLS